MNKKQKKTIKTSIIICSLVIPMAMLFGFLIPNGKAAKPGHGIPPEDPRNKWEWYVHEGQMLYYEFEMKVTDNETKELIGAFRTLEIVNITSFENKTMDLMGGTQWMSQVNATNYYYDCVDDELKALDPKSSQIAAFGFNDSAPYGIYMTQDEGFFPLIVPFNNTQLNVTALSNIFKEFLDNMYYGGFMNYFNDYGWNIPQNKIWFKNTTEDYFANFTFNDGDGALEYGEVKVLVNMGDEKSEDDMWAIIEYKITRVLDYYLNDEIEWGVEVGKSYYFGNFGEEFKVDITGFNCSMYEIETMWDEIPMAFENVLANLSIWNYESEEWEINQINQSIAFANDLYPFHPFAIEMGIALIPNNTKLQDLEFLGTIYEAYGVDVDIHDEVIIELDVEEEESIEINMNFNNDTGIIKLFTVAIGGELDRVLFRKNTTLLTGGTEVTEELWSELIGNNKVFINFTRESVNPPTELYWAVLPVNPLEPQTGRFPYEIPDLGIYIDVYVNDSIMIYRNRVNFTINYDDQPLIDLDIDESELVVYRFNESLEWIALDPSNYSISPGSDTIHVHTKGMSFFAVGTEETWNWSTEINVDDLLIYESRGKLGGDMGPEIGEIYIPFINHAIMNITDIGLADADMPAELGGGLQEIGQINASMMYWDPTVSGPNKLVHDSDPINKFQLSEYYYNGSRKPNFAIHPNNEFMGIPMIVPLRWGHLYLPAVAKSLNDTFFSMPEVIDMGLPTWDNISVNALTNTILFNETWSDYFMELTYYDNGTLMEAEFFITVDIYGALVEFNLTSKRLFDPNTTDEVDWAVEEGDSIYYGSNFHGGSEDFFSYNPTIEYNMTIIAINESAVYLADLFDFGDEAFMFETWLTFQNVWAEIQYWNVTDLGDGGEQTGEWINLGTTIIAAANNYFPFAPGNYSGYHGLEGYDFILPIILPEGIEGYDLANEFADIMAMIPMALFDGELIPTISGKGKDYLKIDLTAPGHPDFQGSMEWYLDNNTGITRLWYLYFEEMGDSFIISTFLKNYTGTFNSDKKFKFDNYLVPDVNITLKIESNFGDDYEFMEALLHLNPVNSSMPSGIGTPMFFTDIFFINYTSVPNAYSITFYIELPSKYKVGNVKYMAVYIYNLENPEESGWMDDKLENMFEVVRYSSNNTLVLSGININGTIAFILAWMYSAPSAGAAPPAAGDDDDDDDEKAEIIPGYDIHLLLLVLSLISIVLVVKRRKIIELFKK